jgi:hypothetical protein
MAFIDGLFVSVLLLCSSFIAHVLGSMLERVVRGEPVSEISPFLRQTLGFT